MSQVWTPLPDGRYADGNTGIRIKGNKVSIEYNGDEIFELHFADNIKISYATDEEEKDAKH